MISEQRAWIIYTMKIPLGLRFFVYTSVSLGMVRKSISACTVCPVAMSSALAVTSVPPNTIRV